MWVRVRCVLENREVQVAASDVSLFVDSEGAQYTTTCPSCNATMVRDAEGDDEAQLRSLREVRVFEVLPTTTEAPA